LDLFKNPLRQACHSPFVQSRDFGIELYPEIPGLIPGFKKIHSDTVLGVLLT